MLPTLHAIERSCTRVPGSLTQIILIDPDDLEELPDYFLIPNVEALNFKSGKSAWAFGKDLRGRLEDNTNTNEAGGDYFEYILTATVRNIRLDVEYLRMKLINRRIHLVVTYGDGLQRFIPYMRLTAAGDSGERTGSRNQYTFKATARIDRPAPLVDTALSGSIGDGVPDPGDGESTVTPVVISTSSPTYIYSVPAGKLLAAIWIRSDAAQSPQIGTTSGGDELGGPASLGSNEPGLFGSHLLRPTTPTNIYFSGMAGNNTIEIWLLG